MRAALVCISSLLVLLIWAVFGQTLTFGFVNYDDPVYVTSNLQIQAPLDLFTVWDAFTEVGRSGNWHPLTWISLMADYQLFGLEPWGYHLTNVLLHTANTVLLLVLLNWATGELLASALVAGFFAVHPAHVESVAWVTERKDVLSTLFWMLTMLAYLSYVQCPGWKRYACVLLSFALGLLAKPMVITLPAVLLLLDYWPLGRFAFAPPSFWKHGKQHSAWQLLCEKIPLLVLCAGSAMMTIWAQERGNALRSLEQLALSDRLGNALLAYATYLRQLVWPSDLAPFHPRHPWQLVDLFRAAVVVAFVSMAVVLQAWRRPMLLVGWLWFVGTLVPVIGIVQVGSQAHADRYTYIPFIGLFIAIVWLVLSWAPLRRWRIGVAFACLAMLSVSAATAFLQTRIWRDSIALWEHTLQVTSGNFVAHCNLASAYWSAGRPQEAMLQVQKASTLCPNEVKSYLHVARLWSQHGQRAAAATWLEKAILKFPTEPSFYDCLAQVLRSQGRDAEAQAWEEAGQRAAGRSRMQRE